MKTKKIIKIGKSRNGVDKFFENFPTVVYKVTGTFGLSELGELREARLIAEGDDNTILVYHPADKGGSGCFEICEKVDDVFVSSKFNWVNVVNWKGK